MCGRFALTATPAEVEQLFEIAGLEPFPPRYNIAPTQPVAIVRDFVGTREGVLVRWGLVPGWVKDPASFSLLINARSETAAEKPAFRAAMRHRRCLVPASGFYEWRRDGGVKQPYWIAPRDGGLLAFAGLWETWMGKDGSEIDTAAILTTGANASVAAIHDRMPVVIAGKDFARWLDPLNEPRHVADLLRAPADDLLVARPVSARVNSARNDGAELQEEAVEQGVEAGEAGEPGGRKRAGGGQMELF